MMITLKQLEARSIPEPMSGCWIWLGEITPRGYGRFRKKMAHRLSYERLKGPIPDNLVIDHLCRNRLCVNPDHLEPVTSQENTLRGVGVTALNAKKTHCHRGHEFTPENTIVQDYPSRKGRHCRRCQYDAQKAWKRKKKLAALSPESKP